jgi:dGTPase
MNAVQAAKDLAKRKIFNHVKRIELEIGAYATIGTLLSAHCQAVDAFLRDPAKMTYKDNRVMSLIGDNNFHPAVFTKGENYRYLALMGVIDYISGMTDNYATSLAKQFNGMGEVRY